MIDRYLLRYFLAVLDHGNFSKAATYCRVSQPTLSIGIARLEKLLDRTLFHRTNRRVELTAAGSRFAVFARRIEAEFAGAERAVREDAPAKLIRLGVVATLPAHWIAQAVRQCCGSETDERLEIVEGRGRDLMSLLERGRIDAVLGPVGADPRAREILFHEDYALALSVDHRLAGCDSVAAEDVAGEPMIVRRNCEALGEISRHFTSRGVRPFMAARTTNDEWAVGYVQAGLGITVMPRCFARRGIAMPSLAGFAGARTIGFLVEREGAGRLEGSYIYHRFGNAIADAHRQSLA